MKAIIFKLSLLCLFSFSANSIANPPFVFSSGQVISASEMNSNFSDIYSKLTNGTILEISSNRTQPCETWNTTRNVMVFDVLIRDDGGYNTSSGAYTVPTDDYYSISAKIVSSVGKYYFSYRVNGGTWEYLDFSGSAKIIKLNQGQTLEFGYLCDNKKGDTQTNIDVSGTFATIIPL